MLRLLALAATVAAGCSSGAPSEAPRRIAPVPPSCEPSAPLRILVEPPEAAQDVLDLDVALEPGVDVLDLRLEVRLPEGGSVLEATPRGWGVRTAGDRVRSRLRVATPDVDGFSVELVAVATIADPSVPSGVGRVAAEERLVWGEPRRASLGVEVRTFDAAEGLVVLSRDVPARHRSSGEEVR